MFDIERTIHIAVEVLIFIALFMFLSTRIKSTRQVLEERVQYLEERLGLVESVMRMPATTLVHMGPPPCSYPRKKVEPEQLESDDEEEEEYMTELDAVREEDRLELEADSQVDAQLEADVKAIELEGIKIEAEFMAEKLAEEDKEQLEDC